MELDVLLLVSKSSMLSSSNAMLAAIACNIASGQSLLRAVKSALRYVEVGIKTGPSLGKGFGPLNHFHSLQTLPFAR
jgi:hydroxymethylpyrimidine/phosphomethylpyrimidine kinase / thiaminase